MNTSSRRTRACIISNEIVGPFQNGGVGTHCYYLAQFLSQELSQEVTFLYTGHMDLRGEAYWQQRFRDELDIHFVWISPKSPPARPAVHGSSDAERIARKVLDWLQGRTFDVCHFQDMMGHGFRAFQAKRLGVALQETLLTCMLHSSWTWICEAMQMFPTHGLRELQTKHLERYCIAHCDALLSPSQYMMDWVGRQGIPLPAQQHILPYLFDPTLRPAGYRPVNNHLIFFGRLETRKGLLVFLEALQELDRRGHFKNQPLLVTFLGKSGVTPDGNGLASIKRYRETLSPSIQFTCRTNLGHHEAMAFLRQHNDALIVCPALLDNSPFAIIECLQLGLNIIAADRGGIPELFEGRERLFVPEPVPLAEKLLAGLANQLPPPVKRYTPDRSRQLWTDFCNEIAPQLRTNTVRPHSSAPVKAHVIVDADSSATAAAQTLKALAAQTYRPVAVTVVTSSPPDPRFVRPCWEFLDTAATLTALQKSDAKYLIFLSAGSVPRSDLFEKFVIAAERTGVDALTCCLEVQLPGQATLHSYEPLGACLEAGIYWNVFGCGGVMLRNDPPLRLTTTELTQVLSPKESWAFLAHWTLSGRSLDTLPEHLITLATDRSAFASGNANYQTHMAVLNEYAQTMPPWGKWLLQHAAVSDQAFTRPKISLAAKLRREARRLFQQAQQISRRAATVLVPARRRNQPRS